jgi:hypothetical protein
LKRLRLGAGLALAGVLAWALVQKRPEADHSSSFASAGPQVGQRLPEFRLPDTSGRMRTFADLTGPDGLVLVFNQSADW